MSKTLDEMFNLDKTKNEKLARYIGYFKVIHPGHRYHFMSHMRDKMKDPNHQACSLELELLCLSLKQQFTEQEINLFLEEIDPTDLELERYGILDQVNDLKKKGNI